MKMLLLYVKARVINVVIRLRLRFWYWRNGRPQAEATERLKEVRTWIDTLSEKEIEENIERYKQMRIEDRSISDE